MNKIQKKYIQKTDNINTVFIKLKIRNETLYFTYEYLYLTYNVSETIKIEENVIDENNENYFLSIYYNSIKTKLSKKNEIEIENKLYQKYQDYLKEKINKLNNDIQEKKKKIYDLQHIKFDESLKSIYRNNKIKRIIDDKLNNKNYNFFIKHHKDSGSRYIDEHKCSFCKSNNAYDIYKYKYNDSFDFEIIICKNCLNYMNKIKLRKEKYKRINKL